MRRILPADVRYSGIARNHVKPALGRLALDKVDAPRIQRLYAQMHDDYYKPSDALNASCRHSPVAGSRAEDALDRSQRRHDVQGPPQRDRDASDRAFDSEQLRLLALEPRRRGHARLPCCLASRCRYSGKWPCRSGS